MVVFGGQDFTDVPLSSIYLLDLKTLVWTRGVDADPSQKRLNMACTVAGDNFIAWGGDSYPTRVGPIGTLIIYNLKINQWTAQFSIWQGRQADATADAA
ncbi:hypothetical protein KI688_006448 [Linnemannia hyalina]|uniref:Galactose oxidase n=1 Tax=Linnemannia hyalina TaxID=64524 RepID=A0A9P7Y606_9FUNG|nr:hypothetical protein KI688_006448 [Linnemannia hyalina]